MKKKLLSKNGTQEFLLVGLAQVVSLISGLVGLKILTNIISVEQFGVYQLSWSVALIVGTVLFNPIGLAIIRLYPMHEDNGTSLHFFNSNIKQLLWLSAFLLLGGIILSLILTNTVSLPFLLGLATILFVLAHCLTLVFQHNLTAQRNRPQFVMVQFLVAFGRPLGAALFILYFSGINGQATSGILGSAIALFLVSIFQLNSIMRNNKKASVSSENNKIEPDNSSIPKVDPHTLPSLYEVTIPMVIIGTLTALSLYSDRWLMVNTISAADIGIYVAIYTIATAPLNFAHGVVGRFWLPLIFSLKGNSTETESKKSAHRSATTFIAIWILMVSFLVVISLLGHNFVVTLLTNPKIALYSSILPILLLGLALERTAQVMTVRGNLEFEIYRYIPARLMHILFLMVCGFILMYYFGIYGFAIAHVIAGVVLIILTWWVNKYKIEA